MKKTIRIVLIALAAMLALGIAALAVDAATSAGTEDDPLVTLSYINDVFVPYVTDLFRKDLEEKETALRTDLEDRVAALERAGLEASSGGSRFAPVTLEAGQTLLCSQGTEILLRSGRAVAASSDGAGLADTGTSGSLSGGEALAVNHMYMATGDGVGVRAEETATILVRGEYTIS